MESRYLFCSRRDLGCIRCKADRSTRADGVQAATRFVATKECDASSGYKKAYVNAKETDVKIIKSPVGMPGRALNNAFIQKTERAPESVERCYHCIKTVNRRRFRTASHRR